MPGFWMLNLFLFLHFFFLYIELKLLVGLRLIQRVIFGFMVDNHIQVSLEATRIAI